MKNKKAKKCLLLYKKKYYSWNLGLKLSVDSVAF